MPVDDPGAVLIALLSPSIPSSVPGAQPAVNVGHLRHRGVNLMKYAPIRDPAGRPFANARTAASFAGEMALGICLAALLRCR